MTRLFTILLFVCSIAFGSGRLSVQPNYWPSIGTITPDFNLEVYERVWGPVFLKSYFGMGWQPRELKDSDLWVTAMPSVELASDKVSVGLGYKLKVWNPQGELPAQAVGAVFARITYQIWE